jgi:hypothetical protein
MLHVVCSTLHVARCTLHVAPLLAALGFMLYTRCVRRGADLRTAASVEPTRAAHRTLCVRLGFVSAPLRLPPFRVLVALFAVRSERTAFDLFMALDVGLSLYAFAQVCALAWRQ